MGKKKQHGGKRPGAGRKPAHAEGRTVTIAASVPESLVAGLDDLADRKGWSRSTAITEAIRGLLARKKSRS
jgi:predicted transcriptional regulator